MLMAGLDGVQKKLDPGDPLDKDIYALSPEELRDVARMPVSLEEALDALGAPTIASASGSPCTRCGSGPRRTSFSCTTTSEHAPARHVGRGPTRIGRGVGPRGLAAFCWRLRASALVLE